MSERKWLHQLPYDSVRTNLSVQHHDKYKGRGTDSNHCHGFWASLEHKIYYKFEGNAPERIRKELRECADIVAFLDQKMLSINEEVKTYSSLEDKDAQYREIVSDTFQHMIKDSYGTVVDEEESVSYAQKEVSVVEESEPPSPKKEDKKTNHAAETKKKEKRSKIFKFI